MKIVRSGQVEWKEHVNRGPVQQRRKPLGGEKLRAGLWELPPGKKSFPYHMHHVTEEAMFVVSGRCQVRTPEGLTEIGPGDYVSFPAGGGAHQLINGFEVAFAQGSPPTGKRLLFRAGDPPDYWEGEE